MISIDVYKDGTQYLPISVKFCPSFAGLLEQDVMDVDVKGCDIDAVGIASDLKVGRGDIDPAEYVIAAAISDVDVKLGSVEHREVLQDDVVTFAQHQKLWAGNIFGIPFLPPLLAPSLDQPTLSHGRGKEPNRSRV